jgi:hypothetical protein
MQNLTAAQRTPPPPDPVQVNRDVRAGTQSLDRDVNAGVKNLQRLTNDANRFDGEAKRAKGLADKADKVAQDAMDAAMNCDEARFARLSKQATDLVAQARNAKEKADAMGNEVDKRVKETLETVNNRISNLQNLLGQGFKAAKEEGLADSSVTVGNLRDAQNALNQELAKQNSGGTKENNFQDEGGLSRLNKAKNEFDNQMKKIRESHDSSGALEKIEQRLTDGAALLKKNCPPKVGAVPKTPTEVYVAVDNRPEVLTCISPGQDTQVALNALGLGKKFQTLMSGPTGTIVKSFGDAKTIEKNAQAKGVNLCFKPENDYCTIMTPLTPFRGHDHEAHKHSGRGPHEHDGPDPPLDWGVTPPEIVVRWEQGDR